MYIPLFLICIFATTDSRPMTDSDLTAGFLDHVSAAKWPGAPAKNPPARVERDTEGNVIRLHLDGMQLVPGDLDALTQLVHLESISFNHTNIMDAQIKKLAELPRLNRLTLNHTAMGDDGVKLLAELPSLKVLCLGGVKASREAVKALHQAKPKLSMGYFHEGE
jgi:hypothetical protein